MGRRLIFWISRHQAELLLGLRMTVASLLAFALAELFALPQGYFAVLTTVIVMHGSVGGVVIAAGALATIGVMVGLRGRLPRSTVAASLAGCGAVAVLARRQQSAQMAPGQGYSCLAALRGSKSLESPLQKRGFRSNAYS